MIKTVLELQKFLLSQANLIDDPIFKSSYLLTSPGCSHERLDLLFDIMPDLPDSYLNLIKEYSLNGVEVGYFDLNPYDFEDYDTVDGLIKASLDPFFPIDFMKKHHIFQIGSWNTDQICVTSGTEKFRKGEILYVNEGSDVYNPDDNQIQRLAKDFEQFLIVAGNLNQIHREINDDDSNSEEKKQEFIHRLKALGVSEDYHPAWLSVF